MNKYYRINDIAEVLSVQQNIPKNQAMEYVNATLNIIKDFLDDSTYKGVQLKEFITLEVVDTKPKPCNFGKDKVMSTTTKKLKVRPSLIYKNHINKKEE